MADITTEGDSRYYPHTFGFPFVAENDEEATSIAMEILEKEKNELLARCAGKPANAKKIVLSRLWVTEKIRRDIPVQKEIQL